MGFLVGSKKEKVKMKKTRVSVLKQFIPSGFEVKTMCLL